MTRRPPAGAGQGDKQLLARVFGDALEPGHAFSVEPGIYTPGAWGLRLEDIVVATEAGPLALNRADHDLVVVEA